jgi:hypothetical protein
MESDASSSSSLKALSCGVVTSDRIALNIPSRGMVQAAAVQWDVDSRAVPSREELGLLIKRYGF